LFMFLDYDDVPPTNNSSEQALRPSVIFRKVTNGFRSQKGKDIFSYFRTVVDTAKKQKINIFNAIVDIFSHNKKNTVAI
ncbi:MAG: transposase, partial [Candidatus Sericytochromatia bacterium]|nr:transposase [Candidatus Sericytochromatia bacterium]